MRPSHERILPLILSLNFLPKHISAIWYHSPNMAAFVAFDGEQILVMFAIVAAIILFGLIFLSIFLVRLFKSRLGRNAYWLASLPWLALLVTGLIFAWINSPNTGPPKQLSAVRVRGLLEALPDYASFTFSGLAFYKGTLYVSTNLGLLEVRDGKVASIYRVQRKYSVVSGPWFDRTDQLLWLMDDGTQELLTFDGVTWRRVKIPPTNGVYASVGAEGLHPVSNANQFLLAAGGSVWRWDASQKIWHPEPQPGGTTSAENRGTVIGALPVENKVVFIMRRQLLPFMVKSSDNFQSDTVVLDNDGWRSLPDASHGGFLAETWVAAGDYGYICTSSGALLKISLQSISKLDAPAECEAITSSDRGTLLASFRRTGIYEFVDGHWVLRASHPYAKGEGEYWAYLTEESGKLAYALSAKPVIDKNRSSGRDMMFTRNAPTSLWVTEGSGWKTVEVP
jgi:hypothetical protein